MKHVQLYQEATLMGKFHGRVISKKSVSLWVRKGMETTTLAMLLFSIHSLVVGLLLYSNNNKQRKQHGGEMVLL